MANDKQEVIELVSILDDTGFKKAKKSVKELTKLQKKQETQTKKNTSSVATMAKKFVGLTAIIIGLKKAWDFSKQLIKTTRDAQEVSSKFNVVFRDIKNVADAMANELATSYGLASTEAKKLLSNTGDLLAGFGFSQKQALKLSTQVNKLAVDLASFSNYAGGTAGASQALTKALLGETESAKSLGIVINQNSSRYKELFQQYKDTTGATDNQAKAMAILEMATEQSKNAIGDFARTQKEVANQERILTSNTKDLQEELGNNLLPTYNKILLSLNKYLSSLKQVIKGGDFFQETIIKNKVEIVKLQAELDKWTSREASFWGYSQKQIDENTEKLQKRIEVLQAGNKSIEDSIKVREKQKQDELSALGEEEQANKQKTDEEIAEEKRLSEARVQIRLAGFQQEQQIAEEFAEASTNAELLAIKDKYTKQIEIQEQSLEERKRLMEEEGIFNEEQNALYLAQLEEFQIQKKDLENTYNEERKGQFVLFAKFEELLNTKRAKNFQQTLGTISSLSSSENKKLAAIGKAASIAQATIDTYQAANVALASAGPPLNYILAAATTAAGLANVSQIAGVQLKKGGFIEGSSDGVQATIGEANRNEAVLPLENTRTMSMLGKAIGEYVGTGSSTASIVQNITINGSTNDSGFIETLTDQIRNKTQDALEFAKVSYRQGSKLQSEA